MSVPKGWIATRLPDNGPKLRLPPGWTVEALSSGEWRASDPAGRASALIELRRIAVLPDYDREKVLRQLLAGLDGALRREALLEPPAYARADGKTPHAFVSARYRASRDAGAALVHRWTALHHERGGIASLQVTLTVPHTANDRPDVSNLAINLADMLRDWHP